MDTCKAADEYIGGDVTESKSGEKELTAETVCRAQHRRPQAPAKPRLNITPELAL